MSCQHILGAVHLLEEHGELSIGRLALLLGVTQEQLRAEIEAFNDIESAAFVADPLFEFEFVEDIADHDRPPLPSPGDRVHFSHGMGGGDLGLRHLDAGVLGPLQAAGYQLACLEPGNMELAAALDILSTAMLGGAFAASQVRMRQVGFWCQAATSCRAVRMTYSNVWTPRIRTRVVHPYQVMSTARGFELDAGPLDAAGAPRTFLLDRVASVELLAETFSRPPRLSGVLDAHRQLTRVTGYTPHCGMWAIRHWSERIAETFVDSHGVVFEAWLLPPVRERVDLMLLLAGPEADVDDPVLSAGRAARARQLMAHHDL